MAMTGYLRRHNNGAHQRFEHARRHIEYATVKATLANWTDGAILLSGEHLPMETWLPRQALAPASQALIYRSARGSEIEIQVELKMALSKGLCG